jgi:hypothetical protein
MPKISPTRRSCCRASSYGFTRRCETDGSVAVMPRRRIPAYRIVNRMSRRTGAPPATGYATIRSV